MRILNIAGYKFIPIQDLQGLRDQLKNQCDTFNLKGTILLSNEGININLAGEHKSIQSFKEFFQQIELFQNVTFRESFSDFQPFRFMKVKIKKEIITMRAPVHPETRTPAPHLPPEEFKKWLDEGRDITVLDTRNDYEIRFGTFKNAVHLKINDFSDFPEASDQLSKDKPIVMFCTGGIRCEKAALHLIEKGFPEIYQLQGGILNYFAKIGGHHYDGECFVFDQRVALDTNLEMTGTLQCVTCEGPLKSDKCMNCSNQ